MRNNIYGIQYLRGFAAIIVVFNHLWSEHGGVISKNLGFDIIGGFGVDVFFVISGFIMAYTLSDYNKENRKEIGIRFIKKRLIRIYPLHILAMIPMLAIYIATSIIKGGQISIYSIIGNFLLIPDVTSSHSYHMINPVEWTLVYEMIFYFTLSITICFSKNKKTGLITYSAITTLIVVGINTLGFNGDRLQWVNLRYIIGDTLFIDFIFGFIIYYLLLKLRFSVNFSKVTMLILLLSVTGVSIHLARLGLPRLYSFGVPAFLLVLLFSLSSTINQWKSDWLLFAGSASYAIYLTHPIYIRLYKVIRILAPSIGDNNDIVCMFISLLALSTGFIVHKYIERWIGNQLKENNKFTYQ